MYVDVFIPHNDYINDVYGTITYQLTSYKSQQTNKIIMLSVIDCLVKGVASQAIQNMSIMFGLNETADSTVPAFYP